MDYPREAGFTEPTTSKDAAEAIEKSGKAQTLRSEVLRVLYVDRACQCNLMMPWDFAPSLPSEDTGMTADEIAAELGESPFSIRPRVTELSKQGLITRTGERRKSCNGRMSAVWRLVRD